MEMFDLRVNNNSSSSGGGSTYVYHPSWIEYVTNGLAVDGTDTEVTTPVAGTRTEYTYRGDTIYRFTPTADVQSDNAFYSDSALTQLLVRRA